MTAPHPRMHGLTHVPGGPDPVPGLLPSFNSYGDMIEATPSLWAYWPLDDPAGYSFRELVNGWDMTAADQPPDYMFTYGLPGPIVDDPATSIGFLGKDGTGLQDYGTRAWRDLGGEPDYPFTGSRDFTVEVWFYPTPPVVLSGVGTATFYGMLWCVGDASNYQITLYLFHDGQLRLQCGSYLAFFDSTVNPFVNGWNHAAVTFDGATYTLWLNGQNVGSQTGTSSGSSRFMVGRDTNEGSTTSGFFEGRLAHVAIYDTVLDDTTIGQHAAGAAATGVAGEGSVVGIDENGDITWVQPKIEVTVNGDPADTTPNPPPGPVPPPDTSGPDGSSWIQDQPFTWGGPTFEVPPNKWTTIPFTTPLMERQSTPSGSATTWVELDWDDPDAAGWIDPATPRVITVPHDIDFNPGNSGLWLQICLKLEIPPVEDEIFVEGAVTRGSHRGLRVFETTHQKSLVEAYNWRGACCDEHGAIDVFRDPTKHPGLLGDANMFALGDPGGDHNGEHGNIMLVPNSGYGYYVPGADWLPGHQSGNPTLKKGMRLVPQVWHNAHQPLTFDCTGVLPYRPHFVLTTPAPRSWGPPWSGWPT